MTVKELKKLLEEFDDNDLVVLSKDAEGNDFSPLAPPIEKCLYKAFNGWRGEIGEEGNPACVMWPTN